MHMADALLSPAVGVGMWAVSGAMLGWSCRQVRQDDQERIVPLMGVLGAFVFAAQMINFAIPGTGSSGHLGGGLLLAVLLGPHAALIVMASILTVQALFFADGGLLALGANIFNLGVVPCYLVYPLIRRVTQRIGVQSSRAFGSVIVISAIGALQLGALAVVMQTRLSEISALPLGLFLLFMLPIHLAIGLVEGLASAAILLFVRQHRPDLLRMPQSPEIASAGAFSSLKPILAGFGLTAILLAGMVSGWASSRPDGLEWSIANTAGKTELTVPETSRWHAVLARAQARLSLFAEYQWPTSADAARLKGTAQDETARDSAISAAGLLGALCSLLVALLAGYSLRRRRVT